MRAPCWIAGSDRSHCVAVTSAKRVPRLLIDALIKHSCALAATVDNAARGGLGGVLRLKLGCEENRAKKRSCPFLNAHENLLLLLLLTYVCKCACEYTSSRTTRIFGVVVRYME